MSLCRCKRRDVTKLNWIQFEFRAHHLSNLDESLIGWATFIFYSSEVFEAGAVMIPKKNANWHKNYVKVVVSAPSLPSCRTGGLSVSQMSKYIQNI